MSVSILSLASNFGYHLKSKLLLVEMDNEVHLLRFTKLVKAGMNLLCPSRADVGLEVYRRLLKV